MAHDVFISYSTPDSATAELLRARLEERGIRCWIAPRDIPHGTKWASSLVHAIRESCVLVIVFSRSANDSLHVMNEVGLAFDSRIPILPFRIENLRPTEDMEYFLRGHQWLDALPPPPENYVEKLVDAVERLLAQPTVSAAEATLVDKSSAPETTLTIAAERDAGAQSSEPSKILFTYLKGVRDECERIFSHELVRPERGLH